MGIKSLAGSFGGFEPPTGNASTQHRHLGIGPDPHEGRESGYTAIGQFLVTERDDAAHQRWVLTLGVGETGAHGKSQAVRQFDDHRAQPTGVTPTAGQMFDYAAFERRGIA